MININGELCYVVQGQYTTNGATAISLICEEDGSPWCTLSVNVEGVSESLESDEIVVKHYSENETTFMTMLEKGMIGKTGKKVQVGYVTCGIFKYTRSMIDMIEVPGVDIEYVPDYEIFDRLQGIIDSPFGIEDPTLNEMFNDEELLESYCLMGIVKKDEWEFDDTSYSNGDSVILKHNTVESASIVIEDGFIAVQEDSYIFLKPRKEM